MCAGTSAGTWAFLLGAAAGQRASGRSPESRGDEPQLYVSSAAAELTGSHLVFVFCFLPSHMGGWLADAAEKQPV